VCLTKSTPNKAPKGSTNYQIHSINLHKIKGHTIYKSLGGICFNKNDQKGSSYSLWKGKPRGTPTGEDSVLTDHKVRPNSLNEGTPMRKPN
jgi:hypothetical protein